MILDDNLTFVKAEDAPASTTKAVPIGQSDMAGNTKGLTPYQGLFLYVSAGEAIGASLSVSLETSDTEGGTYETIHEWISPSNIKAGDVLVNERLPFDCRNWLRLKFSSAARINAHLAMDVPKPPVI